MPHPPLPLFPIAACHPSLPPPFPSHHLPSQSPPSSPIHPDACQSVCRQLHCEPVGGVGGLWGAGLLPSRRPLLLPLTTGEHWPHHNGSSACRVLHHLHAGLLCLLLQDMDRCVRVFCQRCELCVCVVCVCVCVCTCVCVCVKKVCTYMCDFGGSYIH